MSADDAIYRVQFKTEQHYYDLYVRHVFPADMAGFICLEGFLFHEETQVLIDPRVEKLTAEFGDVSTAFVPYHQIIRIDKVERQGESRIQNAPSSGNPKIKPCPCRRHYIKRCLQFESPPSRSGGGSGLPMKKRTPFSR